MITKEIIKLGQKKGEVFKYMGIIKPETNLPSEKITYVKGFKDWEWAIRNRFFIQMN